MVSFELLHSRQLTCPTGQQSSRYGGKGKKNWLYLNPGGEIWLPAGHFVFYKWFFTLHVLHTSMSKTRLMIEKGRPGIAES